MGWAATQQAFLPEGRETKTGSGVGLLVRYAGSGWCPHRGQPGPSVGWSWPRPQQVTSAGCHSPRRRRHRRAGTGQEVTAPHPACDAGAGSWGSARAVLRPEPAAPAQWHVPATPTAAPSRVPWVQFPAVHVTCELPESLHRSPDGCRVPVPCPRGRLMGTPWPWVPGNQHQPIPWKAPRAAAPGLPAEALQPTREPAVTGAGPQGSGQGPAGRGGIRAPLAARPPSGFYLPSPARPNFKGRPARPLPLPWPCGKAPGRPASSPALWSPREQLGTHPATRASTPTSRATRCAPSTHTAFAWAAPPTVPLHSLLPQTRGTPKLLPPGSWSPHLCI